MTVEEAIKIWQKTKSPYHKRDMEKFIHKHKKGATNGGRTEFNTYKRTNARRKEKNCRDGRESLQEELSEDENH